MLKLIFLIIIPGICIILAISTGTLLFDKYTQEEVICPEIPPEKVCPETKCPECTAQKCPACICPLPIICDSITDQDIINSTYAIKLIREIKRCENTIESYEDNENCTDYNDLVEDLDDCEDKIEAMGDLLD